MQDLIGLRPSSIAVSQYIDTVTEAGRVPNPITPEVKSYSDAVYFNYYPLGISLLFTPQNGYKPKTGLKLNELRQDDLVLDSIDLYNMPTDKSNTSRSELTFTTFPISPVIFPITKQMKDKDGKPIERPPELEITPKTTGKEFVQALGEPDRKGGGSGPSSGSIDIWCEWSKDGIMVEFGGSQAKGPNAWDTGKDAAWKVVTLFQPGVNRES
jgi:hypothetical protein